VEILKLLSTTLSTFRRKRMEGMIKEEMAEYEAEYP